MTASPVIAEPDGQAAVPSRRRRLEGWLCLAGFVAAACGLAAAWLAQRWIAFDVLSHFTVHLLIAMAACLAGFLMPRLRLATAAGLVLAGIVAIGLSPRLHARLAPVPAAAPAGMATLKVMSFNTYLRNLDNAAIAAEVRRHDPDVVALIEFAPGNRPILDDLADLYPYRRDCFDRRHCMFALFSKHPFHDFEARAFWRGTPYIQARLGPEFGNVTVVGVHSLRPPHFRSQQRQLAGLAAHLDGLDGPKIVMGDFNATPYSRMIATFAGLTGLERLTWLPTWPALSVDLPQLAIDHIFVSPGIVRAGPVRLGATAGSDHKPVIAVLAVPR